MPIVTTYKYFLLIWTFLGPPCFPLIGSWYAIPGQGIEKRVSEWRKKYGNIIGHRVGFKNFVVISGYKEAVSALKNDNFQNRTHTTNSPETFPKDVGKCIKLLLL